MMLVLAAPACGEDETSCVPGQPGCAPIVYSCWDGVQALCMRACDCRAGNACAVKSPRESGHNVYDDKAGCVSSLLGALCGTGSEVDGDACARAAPGASCYTASDGQQAAELPAACALPDAG
ncbi:MAG: hypothetical protein HY744_23885 [Deltaproteobacteria bacterium]|nr:hypothetical protein [Deltaproteobacteria bacterium]